ncbi:DUF4291 family protein [Lentzea chajnantorensis]
MRAGFDDQTIVVHQACSPAIAGPAVAAQRFVPPFKLERVPAVWITEWTVSITDVTGLAREVHAAVRANDDDTARALLPIERPYGAATAQNA